MSSLREKSLLQGGKYRIVKVLGQGGFGITYLAIQSGLERKVAIKEFFMKDLCNRDESTSHVSVGSAGSVDMVERFKAKFLKEARNIAHLNHPNIVRIHDIFEENGTAYYVMEYAGNGSLADRVKQQGHLPESVAKRYILQVANALAYVHSQKMNHLDVKPANIMLSETDDAILIDFGMSKQYDVATGNQTSTTPVGISEGYAPMEQYKQGGVGEFSPETDIYSLGATFFKLLTGITPPSASDVNEDGVPVNELKAKGASQIYIDVICKAMEGRKKDRVKDVQTFIDGLKGTPSNPSMFSEPNSDDEATVLVVDRHQQEAEARAKAEAEEREAREETVRKRKEEKELRRKEQEERERQKQDRKSNKILLWSILGIIAIGAVIVWNTSEPGNTGGAVPATVSIIEEERDSIGKISTVPSTFTVDGVSFDMMPVAGGTFCMGATKSMDSDANDDESPLHDVTLSDYYIGKTEVTQALWRTVMGTYPSEFRGDNLPVESVSWNDCQEFIRKLNAKTGKDFRLPTEAEWEYAARGGNRSRGYKYSGSDNIDAIAWYDGSSNSKTHPVATKQANELGIYDMSGNVWEWCSDWYGPYGSNAQTNPKGAASGLSRVYRGGCWYYSARFCRSTYRYCIAPGFRYDYLGFRLALPVK